MEFINPENAIIAGTRSKKLYNVAICIIMLSDLFVGNGIRITDYEFLYKGGADKVFFTYPCNILLGMFMYYSALRQKYEVAQCLARPVFFATSATACATADTTLLSKMLGMM